MIDPNLYAKQGEDLYKAHQSIHKNHHKRLLLEAEIAELKAEFASCLDWTATRVRGIQADAIRTMLETVNPNGFNFIDTEMIDKYIDNLEKE